MSSRGVVPVVFIGVLALVACRRESSDGARSDKSGAESPSSRPPGVSRPAPGPSALREAMGIRGDSEMETHASQVTPIASRKLKSHGGLGELLEGDVFLFSADSVKTCGDQPGKAAGGPLVIGVEVSLKAKSKMTFSPREALLSSGGIVFNASLDLDRELKGCTPLLKVAWLKKDDVLKGYVLFDVPPPEPKNLQLTYQPTRWGGAGQVRVTLPECVSCAGARPALKSGGLAVPAAGGSQAPSAR